MPPIPLPTITPTRSGSATGSVEPGVLERFVRGDDRELDEAIHPLRILAVEHALRRELLHLACEPRFVRRTRRSA